MYQANHTNKNNLGLLPSPSFGGPNRKRFRESLFPQPAANYELPSDGMVANQFLPPSAPLPPTVRLGFNAYEQQTAQKRVCFNPEPNSSANPGYGYYSGGDTHDSYKQQYPLTMNDPYNQLQSDFFTSNNTPNYPIASIPNQSMIPPFNAGSFSSNGCASGYPSPVYPYQQLKENADPNIAIPQRPGIKLPSNHPSFHKTEQQAPKEARPDVKDHPLSRGLQLITVNPEATARWLPLLERFNILFEIFGCFIQQPTPFSSTGNQTEQADSKMFYLKSPHTKPSVIQANTLKCVYWEMESPIVTAQLDKIYRIIGSYDAKNSYLKTFDVRAAKMDEINNWAALVARSNRLLSKMPPYLLEA